MRLTLQPAAGERFLSPADVAVWCRDTIRVALAALHHPAGRDSAIRISPLSDAWLQELEEESSKRNADS